MRKLLALVIALSFIGSGVSFADVQIDSGQKHGTAAVKYFVARNATGVTISKDQVVVFDSNSADGITVKTTTTSEDRLVAGITIDAIPSVTSDNTAANDAGNNNWGRVQTWGYHASVLLASGTRGDAGDNVCTSTTAGKIASCNTASVDNASVGVALASNSGAAGTLNIFVRRD